MSRKSVQVERRQQIMEGLHRCILVKPFDKTSIKEIANAAGVTHGMLHYYFKSKEDILLHYIEYIIETYETMLSNWLQAKGNSFKTAKDLFMAVFDFMNNRITFNEELSRIFIEIWEISSYNKKVRMKLRKAYQKWIRTVADLLENHTEDSESALMLSMTVVAFLEGMSLFSVLLDKEEFSLEDLQQRFKNQFLDKLLS